MRETFGRILRASAGDGAPTPWLASAATSWSSPSNVSRRSPLTSETEPRSSLTHTTSASQLSVSPSAARWRVPSSAS